MTEKTPQVPFKFKYLISWYGLPSDIEREIAESESPLSVDYAKHGLMDLIFDEPSLIEQDRETGNQKFIVTISNPNNYDVAIGKIFAVDSKNERLQNWVCRFKSSGNDEVILKGGTSEMLEVEVTPDLDTKTLQMMKQMMKHKMDQTKKRYVDDIEGTKTFYERRLDLIKQKGSEEIDRLQREKTELAQTLKKERETNLTEIKETLKPIIDILEEAKTPIDLEQKNELKKKEKMLIYRRKTSDYYQDAKKGFEKKKSIMSLEE